MTYYAERKSIKDGAVQPVVYKTGDRKEMEYQFHLFCASAVKTDIRDLDSIEWGTIEQGVIERRRYIKPVEPEPEPEPTPEPEPEPTPEPEGEGEGEGNGE